MQPLSGAPRTVFHSASSHPFYLHWSPDSQQLAFLSGEGGGMLLRNVAADGSADAALVKAGQPSYFAWTPDSQRLLLHTDGSAPMGSLAVWQLQDQAPRALAPGPAFFRAPAWLPDGHTALATVDDERGSALVRLDDDGTIQQRLAQTKAGMVFVLAPDGQQVAYVDMTSGTPSHVHVLGIDGQRDRTVTDQDAVAFVWSPDSTRLAFLTVDDAPTDRAIALRQRAAVQLRWNIADVATGASRAFPAFTPSDEFFSLIPFFDQYAQSLRLWNRAGTALVYADTAGVWQLDTASGAVTRLADGVLAMWMD